MERVIRSHGGGDAQPVGISPGAQLVAGDDEAMLVLGIQCFEMGGIVGEAAGVERTRVLPEIAARFTVQAPVGMGDVDAAENRL